MLFYNITVLLYFGWNKCSLGKHKRDFFQNIKNPTDPKLLNSSA